MKKILIIGILIIAATMALAQSDKSEKIHKIMNGFLEAPVVNMQILIVTRSPIFGNIDTTVGDISIFYDSRYRANFNDDIYLFDGQCIWEYSAENNQATKDCLKDGEVFDNELTTLKHLEKDYDYDCMIPDSVYKFARKPERRSSLPDSLIVTLDREPGTLSLISYNDINGDVNDIIFLDYEFAESIGVLDFEINLPDSVEIIILP